MLQDKPGSLLGVASSAADARVMLEALEAGTAGAVLRTNDPLQVHTCKSVQCACLLPAHWQAADSSLSIHA